MTILYLAARFPTLSETFVYREMLGLRERGRDVIAATVRRPQHPFADPALTALADEAMVIYSGLTLSVLPLALVWRAGTMLRALRDAALADHSTRIDRVKHVGQAAMGIAAAWRMRRRRISAVHAHMANTPTMVALYTARALGVPFSFTGHAADLHVQRTALAFKLMQARFVACISHWHADFYAQVAAIPPARLRLVRCSVAMPAAMPRGGREIVTVARLVDKKGVDLLLDAFAHADLPGWTLRVFGDGPRRAALEARASTLGLDGRVRFEGARAHADCLAAIAGAGIFALPCRTASNSDRDGIPVVLMEAMAAGRAVIAGDLPTIRELILDGRTGLLVPPDDAAALGRQLERLAADEALRDRLGAAARDFVAGEFSDPMNLDRLEAAFDDLPAPA